jgi:hypothetical protein
MNIDWTKKEVSSSALKSAKVSTRNFFWYYQKPREKKGYFDYGSAIELYLIDREAFNAEVAVMDESKRPEPTKNYQTKVNKEWKDNFYEQNADKLIIPSTGKDSFETIQEIYEMVQNHPAADLLFNSNNKYQQEFRWVCPISGLNRYCRTDLTNDEQRYIIDIKTYADDSFERAATKNDHFLQAWDQALGVNASGAMGEEGVDSYYWFAINKTAPYHVDFYKFDLDQAMKVEEVHNSIMHRLKDDLKKDPKDLVYTRTEVDLLKVPNYYK